MPNIDRYLEVLKVPGAEGLRLKSDAIVELVVGGQGRPASKGPATTAQILGLLQEVLPADFRQRAELAATDFHYASPQGSVRLNVHIAAGNVTAWITSDPHAHAPVSAPPAAASSSGNHGKPRHMDEMFKQMFELKASDLHLKSGCLPVVRVNGDLKHMDGRPQLTNDELWALICGVMPERNRVQFEQTKDTDFAYALPDGNRVRCNVFKDIVGVGAVFRQIPSKILTVKDLGVPPAVVKLCDYPKGLILVTGPTGSGKSTTLAALIDHINANEGQHIITIEDPVEFVHPDKKSLLNQREVGVSTMSFKAALRAALREDPDVVLVGELRDLETTEIAIETAETGHLVFATLHTNTAAATVDRIINQFPADRQEQIRLMLGASLIGVVSQTLCRKAGGGRVAALEILICTMAISNLIREGKTFQIQSVMQTSRGLGMQTLTDALLELVAKKTIEPQEAFSCAADKKEMGTALTRAGHRGNWSVDESGKAG